ncbi:MAG TPA: hypothetical protein DCG53_12660 [Syntrophus sp. (in: bacteria)]|jgi:hypothetical protein|nr:hypothetical protein [Syntrophus sp. (in: bacteria)]
MKQIHLLVNAFYYYKISMNIARIKMKIPKPDQFYNFICLFRFLWFLVSMSRFFVYDITDKTGIWINLWEI